MSLPENQNLHLATTQIRILYCFIQYIKYLYALLDQQEDAHQIYAQKMEGIHELQEEANIMETTVLHAEDSGDDPYVPPIDSDRDSQYKRQKKPEKSSN